MEKWKRTLYLLVFVQFVAAIGFSSIFPFLTLYVEELGTNSGLSTELLAGLVFSAAAITMMLTAPIWGALADRHGRKPMVVRATLGAAVVTALMAYAQSAEQLVLLRAAQGAVSGVISAITALIASIVPRERAGYALGLLQVGLWGGNSVGPLIGGVAADAFGFGAAFLVTAALLAIAGLVAWRLVDEEFTPLPAAAAGRRPGFLRAWRHVISMPGVLPTYTARFLNELARSVIMPFVPLFVAELMSGESGVATITGVITALAAIAGTVAAIYLGRLGDRIGHKRVLIASAVAAALFYLPQSQVSAVWQLLALQALTGFAAGGLMPTLSALLATYTDPGEEGAVYGLEAAIMSAARATAPLAGAALVGWLGLRSLFTSTSLLFLLLALVAARLLPGGRVVRRQAEAKSAIAR
ncbi:MAG: MFS transporter [Anaerolineae bacterium]|nr:MFS transporter [Anaerolineae bacterium]